MKKIYVVFECNSHRAYSSYCIKLITTNFKMAEKHFHKYKKDYVEHQDWIYNLAFYQPTGKEKQTGDIFRELELLKHTEE